MNTKLWEEKNLHTSKTTARCGLINDGTDFTLIRLFTGCYIVKV